MTRNENTNAVIKNDQDIKRQVPGITTIAEKAMKPTHDFKTSGNCEQLYHRAIAR